MGLPAVVGQRGELEQVAVVHVADAHAPVGECGGHTVGPPVPFTEGDAVPLPVDEGVDVGIGVGGVAQQGDHIVDVGRPTRRRRRRRHGSTSMSRSASTAATRRRW